MQKHGAKFIIKILNLSALSFYRISQFSEFTNSKIKSYSLLISAMLKAGEKADITAEIAKKLSCMIKFQSRMNDYIRLCENKYRGDTSTLPAYASVRTVIDTINAFLPNHTVKLETGGETDGIDRISVNIYRPDLYSLITYLVSFAVRYLRENSIVIRMDKYCRSIVFSSEGETLLSEDAAKALCSFDASGVFTAKYTDMIFSSSVCKALAGHYGWHFDTIAPGIGFSRIKAALSAPISDESPPIDLHEPQDISRLRSIVEEEFADI